MAKKARFSIDDGGVEYTDYVDLDVVRVKYTGTRQLEVIPGNQGSNTYADDRRYTERWVVTANVDRANEEALSTFLKAAYGATTALRVYEKAGAVAYTDHTGVKLLSYSYDTMDFQRFMVTLVVAK
jgi:hypothetical protein